LVLKNLTINLKQKRMVNVYLTIVFSIIYLQNTYSQSIQICRIDDIKIYYKIYSLLNDSIADSLTISRSSSDIDTLNLLQINSNEIVIYYETDGTNRHTHGSTINLVRYIITNGVFFKQSGFCISKYLSNVYEGEFIKEMHEVIITNKDKSLKKIYILDQYLDLLNLGNEIINDFKKSNSP
jgi:hypothetical protein